jgi:hypothetical protein
MKSANPRGLLRLAIPARSPRVAANRWELLPPPIGKRETRPAGVSLAMKFPHRNFHRLFGAVSTAVKNKGAHSLTHRHTNVKRRIF